MQKIELLEQKYERDSERENEISDEFTLKTVDSDSWDGVQLTYQLYQDSVYYTKFEVIPDSENILLEIILPTENNEIKIKSFIINSPQEIEVIFTPLNNANSISLRISSFSGYSTGKIKIKKLQTSDMFPIIDSDDLINKTKLTGPWFHQINLDGVKTRIVNSTDSPSRPEGFADFFTEQDFIDNPEWIWSKFKYFLPELEGKNVLDIACNAGFYSFELAKKGANVIGIDNSYQDIVRAKFAKKILGIKNTEFQIENVDDIEKKFEEKFDLVLCLGLLYHVDDPAKIIKIVANMTDEAIFETIANVSSQESKLIDNPAMTSDGFVPTVPWLKNAFKESGFTYIEQITEPTFTRVIFKCKKDV